MRAKKRYFRKINKKSCNFTVLEREIFSVKESWDLSCYDAGMPIWHSLQIRLFFSNSYMPNAILAWSILALGLGQK